MYENKIEKIHFIDIPETIDEEKRDLFESQRKSVIRRYLGDYIKVESTPFKLNSFHSEVPKFFSDQLERYNKDQIIVDLTNGTKYMSNVIYASACISQIEKMCYLSIPKAENRKKLPEELTILDYEFEQFSVLKNWESIGKFNFFEILYYMKRGEGIIAQFSKFKFQDLYFKSDFKRDLVSGIRNYFSEEYHTTLTKLGILSEKISFELWNKLKYRLGGKDNVTPGPDSFKGAIETIAEHFCTPFREKQSEKKFLKIERKLKNLRHIDKSLELIRVHRDQAVHNYSFLVGEDEARLVLFATFYLLELIIKSEVF